jgi:hypothetical protein
MRCYSKSKIALAAGLVLFYFSWQNLARETDALSQITTQAQADMERRAQASKPTPEQRKSLEARLAEASALSYPWHDIFDSLEAIGSQRVVVSSFKHDRGTGQSNVLLSTVELKDIENALANLQSVDPKLSAWHLASIEQAPDSGGMSFHVQIVGKTVTPTFSSK